MSREIKFRAWIKESWNSGSQKWVKKKMLYNAFPFIDGKVCLPDSGIGFANEGEFELMQFTGLKDKKGKEIYEGDVMKVNSIIYDSIEPFEKSTETQFEIFCEVIWCEQIAGFDLKKIDGDNKPTAWGFYNENINPFEVIGNIYENPELL